MNVFSPIESGISASAGSSRLFATRTLYQFALTVRANEIHLAGAVRAKSTFVTANVRHAVWSKRGSAFFTDAFKLQSHVLPPFSKGGSNHSTMKA
jgi:hypothetical protein